MYTTQTRLNLTTQPRPYEFTYEYENPIYLDTEAMLSVFSLFEQFGSPIGFITLL